MLATPLLRPVGPRLRRLGPSLLAFLSPAPAELPGPQACTGCTGAGHCPSWAPQGQASGALCTLTACWTEAILRLLPFCCLAWAARGQTLGDLSLSPRLSCLFFTGGEGSASPFPLACRLPTSGPELFQCPAVDRQSSAVTLSVDGQDLLG